MPTVRVRSDKRFDPADSADQQLCDIIMWDCVTAGKDSLVVSGVWSLETVNSVINALQNSALFAAYTVNLSSFYNDLFGTTYTLTIQII